MLLNLLNQPQYAAVPREKFTDILNREVNNAKGTDEAYECACLISSYRGKGSAPLLSPKHLALLGHEYYTGDRIEPDKQKARRMYLLAAERGHTNAKLMLSLIYYRERDGTENIDKAIYWANEAARDGCISAPYLIGNLFLSKKYSTPNEKKENEKQALHWLKRAAAKGDINAQYRLGQCYFEGKGTSPDYNKAFAYTKKAVEQYQDCKSTAIFTEGELFHLFGLLHLDGRGPMPNENKGIHYITLASEKGDSYATLFLIMHQWKDLEEKAKFERIEALAENNMKAKVILGTLYFNKAEAAVDSAEALKLAYEYTKPAADQNDVFAQVQLAYILNKQNQNNEALVYINQAINNRDPSFPDRIIQREVANFYWYKNERTAEEKESALSLYLLLANRGDISSMMSLVLCYLELGKNEEADHWLTYLENSKHELARNLVNHIHRIKESIPDGYHSHESYLVEDIDDVTERELEQLRKSIGDELNAVELSITPIESRQIVRQDTSAPLSTSEEVIQIPAIPLAIPRHRSDNLTNPKLLRQLAQQARYAKKKQEEIEATNQQEGNKEKGALRHQNINTIEEISREKNVKLSLSDLNRLFNDPIFENRIKIKSTASGFMVEAVIQEQIYKLSTHWPHDGILDPKFLSELSNIINKFIQ